MIEKIIPRSLSALTLSLFLLAAMAVASPVAQSNTVLVEAEQFTHLGGWSSDSQFMDQMGSPYLLAHGLGMPVANATTRVELPTTGKYRVWVRTRDWVAPWNAPGAPGRFQLLIDGRPLPKVFGAEGAEWHWQNGGQRHFDSKTIALSLRDLTGFEGRCDAILLSSDPNFTPPNDKNGLRLLRRQLLGLSEKPKEAGRFDLVVVGGGIAGTTAALSAARLGLTVALIQDRPILGGNNSSEVRVWLSGGRNTKPYSRVGDIVAELEQKRAAHYGPENVAKLYEDERKISLVEQEENITLFLNHRANQIEMDGKRIAAAIAQHTITGRRLRISGRLFADTTGDGCLGFLAGADHESTLDGHMGRCNLWNVIETDSVQTFPPTPWAIDLSDKPFPGRSKTKPDIKKLGGWYWESGFYYDPIEKGEYIRDLNLRAMYGAWDAMKNTDKVLPNHRLNWAAFVSGKRESRRLLGDIVLTKEDVLGAKEYPDGCVPTGWPIDLHLPNPRYKADHGEDAFISEALYDRFSHTYWIPYRCLYSRNIANLFMAGRDISVTHEALGTVRVMRTGGCMGEVVGMAASLSKKHNTSPRGVYRSHLDDLKALMKKGVGKPPRTLAALKSLGVNVASEAKVATSGDRDPDASPSTLINDGLSDFRHNELRWLSKPQTPNWVELTWERPRRIVAARILSGFGNGGRADAPVISFVFQYHANGAWKDIPETKTKNNRKVDWSAKFPPITASKIRLFVSETSLNISRIWEIEIYKAPLRNQ